MFSFIFYSYKLFYYTSVILSHFFFLNPLLLSLLFPFFFNTLLNIHANDTSITNHGERAIDRVYVGLGQTDQD